MPRMTEATPVIMRAWTEKKQLLKLLIFGVPNNF